MFDMKVLEEQHLKAPDLEADEEPIRLSHPSMDDRHELELQHDLGTQASKVNTVEWRDDDLILLDN